MNNIQPFRFERECVHGLSGISFKTVLEDHLFYDIQADRGHHLQLFLHC